MLGNLVSSLYRAMFDLTARRERFASDGFVLDLAGIRPSALYAISGSVFTMILFALTLQTPKISLRAGLLAIDRFNTATRSRLSPYVPPRAAIRKLDIFLDTRNVLFLIIFGLVATVVLVLIEWRVAKSPIVPLQVFATYRIFPGVWLHFRRLRPPLYFQSILGPVPLLSGIYFLVLALAVSVSSAATWIYTQKPDASWSVSSSGSSHNPWLWAVHQPPS